MTRVFLDCSGILCQYSGSAMFHPESGPLGNNFVVSRSWIWHILGVTCEPSEWISGLDVPHPNPILVGVMLTWSAFLLENVGAPAPGRQQKVCKLSGEDESCRAQGFLLKHPALWGSLGWLWRGGDGCPPRERKRDGDWSLLHFSRRQAAEWSLVC